DRRGVRRSGGRPAASQRARPAGASAHGGGERAMACGPQPGSMPGGGGGVGAGSVGVLRECGVERAQFGDGGRGESGAAGGQFDELRSGADGSGDGFEERRGVGGVGAEVGQGGGLVALGAGDFGEQGVDVGLGRGARGQGAGAQAVVLQHEFFAHEFAGAEDEIAGGGDGGGAAAVGVEQIPGVDGEGGAGAWKDGVVNAQHAFLGGAVGVGVEAGGGEAAVGGVVALGAVEGFGKDGHRARGDDFAQVFAGFVAAGDLDHELFVVVEDFGGPEAGHGAAVVGLEGVDHGHGFAAGGFDEVGRVDAGEDAQAHAQAAVEGGVDARPAGAVEGLVGGFQFAPTDEHDDVVDEVAQRFGNGAAVVADHQSAAGGFEGRFRRGGGDGRTRRREEQKGGEERSHGGNEFGRHGINSGAAKSVVMS